MAGAVRSAGGALALLLTRDDVPATEVDDVAPCSRAGGWRSCRGAPGGWAGRLTGGCASGPDAVAPPSTTGSLVAFLADPDAPGAAGRRVAAAVDGRPAVLGPPWPSRPLRGRSGAPAHDALLVAGRLPAEL